MQTGILEVARILGYRVHHARPAMTGKGWRTPLQGDKGFVDLVLAGRGRVLFRELKVAKNRLSEEQAGWIAALDEAGADVGVWTDEDWMKGVVEAELQAVEVTTA